MAKSISGAFTKEKTDELYTPRILVECLDFVFQDYFFKKMIDNLKSFGFSNFPDFQEKYGEDLTLLKPIGWCPFDTENSEFVHYLKDRGTPVVYSHLSTGQDFFEYEPEKWDFAISNPPFSKKLKVFQRLNSFEKPWAMVMNTMALNYMEIGNYFADNPIQLLIPDKRISFDGNPSSFNSCYVCQNFLPKDLMFVHMPNCNIGKDFIPSRMYKDI